MSDKPAPPREKNQWYRSKEYDTWVRIRQRCKNPRCNNYESYGAKGIRVCERWEKFENFLADMGPAPSKAHSIDRINSLGNYEPSNCRWATREQQNQNRCTTKSNKSGFRGVHKHWDGKWEAHLKRNGKRFYLGLFNTPEEASQAYERARIRET